jgi:uncharacterized protein (DUF983 family)
LTQSLRPVRSADGPEQHPLLYPGNSFNPPRPLVAALLRGLACRCPACGTGRLYRRFLTITPSCADCGEALHHARPDDAPAYFVMLVVGHVVVSLAMSLEFGFSPPIWITLAFSVTTACALTLALLPPAKGLVIALQWSFWMHGFDPHEQDHSTTIVQNQTISGDQPWAA